MSSIQYYQKSSAKDVVQTTFHTTGNERYLPQNKSPKSDIVRSKGDAYRRVLEACHKGDVHTVMAMIEVWDLTPANLTIFNNLLLKVVSDYDGPKHKQIGDYLISYLTGKQLKF